MKKPATDPDLLSLYDEEILTLQKLKKEMDDLVNNPDIPTQLKRFYASLQKSLLDALELVYLSNGDTINRYIAPSLTTFIDILKIFSSVTPSQYQLALQVSQGVLSVVKDVYGLGNQVYDQATLNRVKIKKKTGRLALSEALAKKVTSEYHQILQHLTVKSLSEVIVAIILRMDLKNAIGDNPSSCLSIDTERGIKDSFGLTHSELFEQREHVEVSSDDIFARPIIKHEEGGEVTYYKPRELKSAKLSCLGFRVVDNIEVIDDHRNLSVILRLFDLVQQPYNKEGRKDLVNSMFLEIMLCDTIERLKILTDMIVEKDKAKLIELMKLYFNNYPDLQIRNIHAINEQQEAGGKARNAITHFFADYEKDTDSTEYLLQGVAERRYVLRKLAKAHEKQVHIDANASLQHDRDDANFNATTKGPAGMCAG